MNYENENQQDENSTELSKSFAAACNNPAGFDFGLVEERIDANFANFGVSEEQHRGIFEAYGVPYPADAAESDEDVSLTDEEYDRDVRRGLYGPTYDGEKF